MTEPVEGRDKCLLNLPKNCMKDLSYRVVEKTDLQTGGKQCGFYEE